ncbi:MAG TPA: hypothetical protein VFR37_11135 [Longimicrobium sp.]|nr:hypothetical protein [Longimicrobium sp.]
MADFAGAFRAEVRDAAGEVACLAVYRRGARGVVRRLSLATA